MDKKALEASAPTSLTALPRHGIGAGRSDVRPMASAYDLSVIPSRKACHARERLVAAVPGKPVHLKPLTQKKLRKRLDQDPFLERLSRLS